MKCGIITPDAAFRRATRDTASGAREGSKLTSLDGRRWRSYLIPEPQKSGMTQMIVGGALRESHAPIENLERFDSFIPKGQE
jgi:hypothetical protein